MPAARQCLECGGVPVPGETVAGGPICSTCWQLLLRTATSQLCDRIIELANMGHYLHPVSISRVVATVLPDRADRFGSNCVPEGWRHAGHRGNGVLNCWPW